MQFSVIASAAVAAALFCTLPGGDAWAAARKPAASSRAKAGAPKKSVHVRRSKSANEESSAERERRLRSECRGLPNAGACRGYSD